MIIQMMTSLITAFLPSFIFSYDNITDLMPYYSMICMYILCPLDLFALVAAYSSFGIKMVRQDKWINEYDHSSYVSTVMIMSGLKFVLCISSMIYLCITDKVYPYSYYICIYSYLNVSFTLYYCNIFSTFKYMKKSFTTKNKSYNWFIRFFAKYGFLYDFEKSHTKIRINDYNLIDNQSSNNNNPEGNKKNNYVYDSIISHIIFSIITLNCVAAYKSNYYELLTFIYIIIAFCGFSVLLLILHLIYNILAKKSNVDRAEYEKLYGGNNNTSLIYITVSLIMTYIICCIILYAVYYPHNFHNINFKNAIFFTQGNLIFLTMGCALVWIIVKGCVKACREEDN